MTALPSNVPKSPIVYNKAKLSLHHQIVMLYQKYIDIDAPLSINLSAETRDRLDKKLTTILKLPPTPITVSSSHGIMQTLDIMRQTTATSTNTNTTATTKTVTPNTFTSSTMSRSHYEEPELWGLLLVFDDCITELYRLLNSSWKRLREKLKKGTITYSCLYIIDTLSIYFVYTI